MTKKERDDLAELLKAIMQSAINDGCVTVVGDGVHNIITRFELDRDRVMSYELSYDHD